MPSKLKKQWWKYDGVPLGAVLVFRLVTGAVTIKHAEPSLTKLHGDVASKPCKPSLPEESGHPPTGLPTITASCFDASAVVVVLAQPSASNQIVLKR